MKVVIFAGGRGSRLSEETDLKPKPMVKIGDKPILWHIMKIYSHYGYKDFVVCLGYKGNAIKDWFANYYIHNSDVTMDLKNDKVEVHNKHEDDWKVTLIDTGLDTGTAGRLAKAKPYVGDGDFMLTYGDGLSDVDINKLVDFHKQHGKVATVTSVQPEGRFGTFGFNGDNSDVVKTFSEHISGKDAWINGGFFVLKPEVFDHLSEDGSIMWEQDPLQSLTNSGQLVAYRHQGFWKPMDMRRDKLYLEELWDSGQAPWKVWS